MTATEVQAYRKEAFDLRAKAETILKSTTPEQPLTDEQDREVDSLIDRAELAVKNEKRAQTLLDAERAIAEREAKRETKRETGDGKLSDADMKRRAFFNYIRSGQTTYETRDQTASVDTEGGYITAPPVILNEILKEVDDARYMRGAARMLPRVPPNGTLGVPFSNNSTLNAAWSAELKTASAGNVAFGGREFKPNYLTHKTFYSWSLVDSDILDVEAWVTSEMAIIAGEKMEEAYMSGTGVGQPLGVFVASDAGIPAGRDTTTDGNDIAFDDIINVFYSLKDQYMRSATWFINRNAFKQVVKIKGTDGHPIFRTGLAPGDPMTIEGRPIVMSEWAPAGTNGVYGTGDYMAAVGDFNRYWICDSTMMRVIRQTETYADQNLLAIVSRQQTDGAPVLGEAFARLKRK